MSDVLTIWQPLSQIGSRYSGRDAIDRMVEDKSFIVDDAKDRTELNMGRFKQVESIFLRLWQRLLMGEYIPFRVWSYIKQPDHSATSHLLSFRSIKCLVIDII